MPNDYIDQVRLSDNSVVNFKVYTNFVAPFMTKTFTGLIGSANDAAGASFYMGKVIPTSYYDVWRIHLRVHVEAAGRTNSKATADSWITGSYSSLLSYANFVSIITTDYRPVYFVNLYRATEAGINNNYGHLIGVGLRSSWNPTTAANSRTVTFEILECENCTFEFFDSALKYADVPGTGSTNYSGLSELTFSSQGLQETGDSDTSLDIVQYPSLKTGAKGIWATSLSMIDSNGTFQNICTASDGTVTSSNRTTANTKKANTNGFRVGSPIFYNTGTYAENSNITGWGALYNTSGLIDSRYSFNTELVAGSLTTYQPVYLVGTINSSDGLFYLDSTWWTQTPNDTSKIYIFLGGVYDSTTSNCRIILYQHNTWLKYNGTRLVEYTPGQPTITASGILKGDGSGGVTAATAGTDYQAPISFDGTYSSSNKAATVSTVTNAINALDGGTIGTGSTTKTITSLSQTNGNVSATFSNIAFPVTSVNTKTGAVTLNASDVGAQATITANGILKGNGSGTISAATAGTDYQAPITFDGTYNASTNKAATVSTVTNAINALDGGTIGTGGTTKTITSLSQSNGNVSATFSNIAFPVTSVNSQTGAVSLSIPDSPDDIGAIADPSTKSSGQVLQYNGTAWVAATPAQSSGFVKSKITVTSSPSGGVYVIPNQSIGSSFSESYDVASIKVLDSNGGVILPDITYSSLDGIVSSTYPITISFPTYSKSTQETITIILILCVSSNVDDAALQAAITSSY